MKIFEIYKDYKLMPSLQLHQLRVASVAKLICDNFKSEIDSHNIIAADLLHDMGNIIKFDLTMYPEFLEPEGLEYWQKVQNDYFDKYGRDEHIATNEIAKELNVSERIMEILHSIGFSQAINNSKQDDFGKKIACYADSRVTPFGVTSLQKRIQDGKERFERNKKLESNQNKVIEELNAFELLEKQIFENCNIKPSDINDSSVNNIIPPLKSFEL